MCASGFGIDVTTTHLDFYCSPCPPGTSTRAEFQPDVCYPCPPGTHQPSAGQGTCLACPPGSFQDSAGQTSCKACAQPAPFAVLEGGATTDLAACGSCTAVLGAHAIQQDARALALFALPFNCTCPPGAGFNGHMCEICPSGSVKDGASLAPCQLCPAGTYQDQENQAYCLSCKTTEPVVDGGTRLQSDLSAPQSPVGSITRDDACTCPPQQPRLPVWNYETKVYDYVCSVCAVGYAVPSNQTICTPCPIGAFRAVENTLSCTPCPNGTTTIATGSKAPSDCICASTDNRMV